MLLPAEARASADARFEAIASLAEQKMREHRVPGVALGIVHAGAVTVRGLGITSVEDPLPVTEHTVFPIASISKTFTATALMRLAEQGKIDLRAPVRRYLPDFRVKEGVDRDVTLWHLLTHTSGWDGPAVCREESMKALPAALDELVQLAPPGAAWSYSNPGYCLTGRVIEAVTGSSIHQAMRDLVFRPLALPHAGTTAGDFLTGRFAPGHDARGEGPPALQRPFVPSTNVTAGGVGLCLTDLLAYARFHVGDGTSVSGDRVLSRASLEQMRAPQVRKHGSDDDMGIGWHLRSVGPLRTASHGGSFSGHVLLLELVPEKDLAIAILTNSNSGWRFVQDVERAALTAYTGVSLAANQAIAYRGLIETVPGVAPMAAQPEPAPYAGRYLRPRSSVVLRVESGRLLLQVRPDTGEAQEETAMSFYGPDRAVITDGPDRGQSVEFLRGPDGLVNWVRTGGRISSKARLAGLGP